MVFWGGTGRIRRGGDGMVGEERTILSMPRNNVSGWIPSTDSGLILRG